MNPREHTTLMQPVGGADNEQFNAEKYAREREDVIKSLIRLGVLKDKSEYDDFLRRRAFALAHNKKARKSKSVEEAEKGSNENDAHIFSYYDQAEYDELGVSHAQYMTNLHLECTGGGSKILDAHNIRASYVKPLNVKKTPLANITIATNQKQVSKNGYFSKPGHEDIEPRLVTILNAYGYEFENFKADDVLNERCPFITTNESDKTTKLSVGIGKDEADGSWDFSPNKIETPIYLKHEEYKQFVKDSLLKQMRAVIHAHIRSGKTNDIQMNLTLPGMGFFTNLGGRPDCSIKKDLYPFAAQAFKEALEQFESDQKTYSNAPKITRMRLSGLPDERQEIKNTFGLESNLSTTIVGGVEVSISDRYVEDFDAKKNVDVVVCVNGDASAYPGNETGLTSQDPGVYSNIVNGRNILSSIVNVFEVLNNRMDHKDVPVFLKNMTIQPQKSQYSSNDKGKGKEKERGKSIDNSKNVKLQHDHSIKMKDMLDYQLLHEENFEISQKQKAIENSFPLISHHIENYIQGKKQSNAWYKLDHERGIDRANIYLKQFNRNDISVFQKKVYLLALLASKDGPTLQEAVVTGINEGLKQQSKHTLTKNQIRDFLFKEVQDKCEIAANKYPWREKAEKKKEFSMLLEQTIAEIVRNTNNSKRTPTRTLNRLESRLKEHDLIINIRHELGDHANFVNSKMPTKNEAILLNKIISFSNNTSNVDWVDIVKECQKYKDSNSFGFFSSFSNNKKSTELDLLFRSIANFRNITMANPAIATLQDLMIVQQKLDLIATLQKNLDRLMYTADVLIEKSSEVTKEKIEIHKTLIQQLSNSQLNKTAKEIVNDELSKPSITNSSETKRKLLRTQRGYFTESTSVQLLDNIDKLPDPETVLFTCATEILGKDEGIRDRTRDLEIMISSNKPGK